MSQFIINIYKRFNMLLSSTELYQFYKDYLMWVESGAEKHPIFRTSHGLCLNLFDYTYKTHCRAAVELSEEMFKQFVTAGLNPIVPFNESIDHYTECALQVCHKNAKRVQWVRDRIEDVKWLCEAIEVPKGRTTC